MILGMVLISNMSYDLVDEIVQMVQCDLQKQVKRRASEVDLLFFLTLKSRFFLWRFFISVFQQS